MNNKNSQPTVLVTGFGPFRNFTKNSSWLTVQELSSLGVEDYHLVMKEIPVEYETVSQVVPSLWEKYHPVLTVHCGMSGETDCLVLEQIANNKHYCCVDVRGKLPASNVCCSQGPDRLCTNIDVKKVAEEIKTAGLDVDVKVSENAGRYLCEFIYYTSLRISRDTIFVHVPPVNEPYTANQMAKTLDFAIKLMLKQCPTC